MPTDLRRAVFFDRDGTLMEDTHYCADPALVRVFEGVPEALRDLKRAGFRVFIITNQSGIGRGLISAAQYAAVTEEFLRQAGIESIDAGEANLIGRIVTLCQRNHSHGASGIA